MKNHTKVYLRFFGIDPIPGAFIPCENCGDPAKDIHHISARGMGGDPDKKKDVPENLIALCRECHDRAELVKTPTISKEEIIEIHKEFFTLNGKQWTEREFLG